MEDGAERKKGREGKPFTAQRQRGVASRRGHRRGGSVRGGRGGSRGGAWVKKDSAPSDKEEVKKSEPVVVSAEDEAPGQSARSTGDLNPRAREFKASARRAEVAVHTKRDVVVVRRFGGSPAHRGGKPRGVRGQNLSDSPLIASSTVAPDAVKRLEGGEAVLRRRGGIRTASAHAGLPHAPHRTVVERPPLLDALEEVVRPGGGDTSDMGRHSYLAASLIALMREGKYECMICYERIRNRKGSHVFSCDQCFVIFHLHCIRHWAQQSEDESGWRCPGCQRLTPPGDIRCKCFCGKMEDPPMDPLVLPHSCGEPCGRMRKGTPCPHPCSMLCHPGPCPPCSALSPPRTCHCGALEYRMRCSDLEPGRSCGGVCGKQLDCGRHNCPRNCHPGSCPPCEVKLKCCCFCGMEESEKSCDAELVTLEDGKIHYSCGRPCDHMLGCGRHRCEMVCHAGDCGPCPRLPDAVSTCPCGAKLLCDLDAPPRSSCGDPIPTCGGVCGKMQECGVHRCASTCHEGPCARCTELVCVTCRCSSRSVWFPCWIVREHNVSAEPGEQYPLAPEFVGVQLRDEEHTSSASDTGTKRPEAVKDTWKAENSESVVREEELQVARLIPKRGRRGRGDRARASAPGMLGEPKPPPRPEKAPDPETLPPLPLRCETKCGATRSCGRHKCSLQCCPSMRDPADGAGAHVCTLSCDKMLRCGQHHCQLLCHRGHCPPCDHVSWDELSCRCGANSIEPPVPCGTAPPFCDADCSIPRECGHPANHRCHFGDCPACVVPTLRTCYGNHEKRPIPCCQPSFSCGRTCGRLLECGYHTCQRPCHSGPCRVSAAPLSPQPTVGSVRRSCGLKCGKQRLRCAHACAAVCHPNEPCPDAPCLELVTVSCECGRKTGKAPCGISDSGLRETPTAPCDDLCRSTLRKRRMAEALGIVDFLAGEPPDRSVFDEHLLRQASARHALIVKAEKAFAELLASQSQGSTNFPPMNEGQRRVLHLLAEAYGLRSESYDREPKRNVRVFKTSSARVPSPLLSELASRAPVLSSGNLQDRGIVDAQSVVTAPAGALGLSNAGQSALPTQVDAGTALLFFNLTPSIRGEHVARELRGFAGKYALQWLNDAEVVAHFPRARDGLVALAHLQVDGTLDVRQYVRPSESSARRSVRNRRVDAAWDEPAEDRGRKSDVAKADVGGTLTDVQVDGQNALRGEVKPSSGASASPLVLDSAASGFSSAGMPSPTPSSPAADDEEDWERLASSQA